MASRVRAPTLGGAGISRRSKRSTLSRLAGAASSVAQLGNVFARRQEKAQRTARISATASLYEAMVEYDSNPDTWGLNPEEKQDHFEKTRDAAVSALAKQDQEGAQELRLDSATWSEKMLADDRKQWQERQAAEAMDARAQILDQARGDLRTATAGLFDRSDPNAPARAAALLGSVKKRFDVATADLPPAVAIALRGELTTEASRMAVDAWLSQAANPAEAYEVLRSNRDEWTLPDGTSFNLSGNMDDVALEKAIDRDMGRRADAYTLQTQHRQLQKNAKERRTTRSVNTVKQAVYSGQLTVSDAREIVADKSTPPEVADKVDEFLDRFESRRGREAGRDPDQLRVQDGFIRAMDGAPDPGTIDAIRESALSDTMMDPDLLPAVLRAGQARETSLARAEAAGTTRDTVSYAKDWKVWKAVGRHAVQDLEGDRLTVIEQNPAMKAQVEAHLAVLSRAGEQLLINSEGRGQAFLENLMPLAVSQVYEEALSGEGLGTAATPTTERWRRFIANASAKSSMEAMGKMNGRQVVWMLQQAGLVGATSKEWIQYTDDGEVDADATLLEFERIDRVQGKVPRPSVYNQQMRTISSVIGVPPAAAQATGKDFLDEDPHLTIDPTGA